MGLPEAAKKSADVMMADPVTGPALTAYTKGVNAFIAGVDPKSLPLEYEILEQKPEMWAPEKAALLMKFMAWSLAGYSQELPLSRSREKLGKAAFDELFPLELFNPEPIVPAGTKWASAHMKVPFEPKAEFLPSAKALMPGPTPHPGNGSNNWAVTGKKSQTGLPILSNDIHLSLSLPSLWYEMQLVSPKQNVYGITLPGAPGIVLGFNHNLAWAVTNGGDDVLDWYEIRYRNEKKSEYVFDGDWRPVISRSHDILVKGEEPHHLSLKETHFGPIVYDSEDVPMNPLIPRGMAMRWTVLEPSNELKTFLMLNRAQNTTECRAAIEQFSSAAQNFLCADNKNDVGLWHMGRFPLKFRGQGRLISDGSKHDYQWNGWVPRDEVPMVRNPERGYLSSSNQRATDSAYPYYLGWNYDVPFRSIRINELLKAKPKFAPEDFISMQHDTVSVSARMMLPLLLKSVGSGGDFTRDDMERRALEILSKWDYNFDESSAAAVVYYAWYKDFEAALWSTRLTKTEDAWPPLSVTLQIMQKNPDSTWFDDPKTDAKENLRTVALSSFHQALEEIKAKTGQTNPDHWRWGIYRPTTFGHLGHLPGLGNSDISASGMEHTIFANYGAHGPVWKLVVALGPEPHAWSVYPGGQSGDATSAHYDDFVGAWKDGVMKEVIYMTTADGPNSRLASRWSLSAKAGDQAGSGAGVHQ
jgi:penicillin amidase